MKRMPSLRSVFLPVLTGALIYTVFAVLVSLYIRHTRDNVWIAYYFPSTNFNGEAVYSKESILSHFWGTKSPVRGIAGINHSSRRYTCLHLDLDATVTFNLASDDGSRLFVDGELILEEWKFQGIKEKSVEKRLSRGEHSIRVDHFQGDGPSGLRLVGTVYPSPVKESFEESLYLPTDDPDVCLPPS
jgi:hypothetical protein